MLTVQHYLGKLSKIVGKPVNDTAATLTMSFHWTTADDAKATLKNLILGQKELRLLKKDINLTAQQISKSYIARRSAIGAMSGGGLLGSLIGRKAVGAMNVVSRRGITVKKDKALLPYRQLIRCIDNMNIAIDRTKSEIELEILRHRSGK